MGYLQDTEKWLEELLEHDLSRDRYLEVRDELKSRILESYHNGQRDCAVCNPPRRAGSFSRRAQRTDRRDADPRRSRQ